MREIVHGNLAGISATAGIALGAMLIPAMAQESQVIVLTQTPCQFLEIEGKDHGFSSTKKADCVAINERTAKERLANSKVLRLKSGAYTFRVTNKNVPYDLGFWVRGAGLIGRATLPSISGGGLSTGASRDYKISLSAGEYHYSCPLNNTPDYKIVVED